jgi:hypothetical protein
MDHLEFSEAFERMTVNQMITLVDLYRIGYLNEVAKQRNRDLSSILKQINTLNDTFKDICGEYLVDTEMGRGKLVNFTNTGEEVVGLANKFLNEASDTIDKRRRNVGKKLTAASTTGMLSIIAMLWPKWIDKARGAFELHLQQIRTYDVRKYLLSGKVDLVFSGLINHSSIKQEYEEFEFLNWTEGRNIVLLTNHTELPSDPVKLGDISNGKIKMILPNSGIISDFTRIVFKEDIGRINTVALIDDLGFGLGLLNQCIYKAGMFAIEALADNVIKQQNELGGTRLYKFHIRGLEDYSISDGIFRKKGAEKFSSNHPINICWEIIIEERLKNLKIATGEK